MNDPGRQLSGDAEAERASSFGRGRGARPGAPEPAYHAERIEDFLKGGKDIVFIVNDGTRPTPTAAVLDALSGHIDLKKVRFLIATGDPSRTDRGRDTG